jgi:hypothetical protein
MELIILQEMQDFFKQRDISKSRGERAQTVDEKNYFVRISK